MNRNITVITEELSERQSGSKSFTDELEFLKRPILQLPMSLKILNKELTGISN